MQAEIKEYEDLRTLREEKATVQGNFCYFGLPPDSSHPP